MVTFISLLFIIAILEIILAVIVARLIFLFKRNQKASNILSKREREINYLNLLLGQAVFDTRSIQDSFPEYLNRLKEIVGWTYHSIFRYDEINQLIIARFTGYFPDWYIEQFSKKVLVRVGDASAGRAVSSKQPATLNSAIVDPRFKSVIGIAKQISYKSLSCCPMIGRLKVYGSLCTYSDFENIFETHDVQYLLTCANIYAAIIEIRLILNGR